MFLDIFLPPERIETMTEINCAFDIKGFYSAFRFQWRPDFTFGGERHDFWEIVFVESGYVEVSEDGRVYRLGEGEIVLHAPMEFHSIHSADGSSPKGYVICFDSSGTLPEHIKNGVFVLDEEQRSTYRSLCTRIIDYHTSDGCPSPYKGQELGNLLSAFLIRLANKNAKEAMVDNAGAYEYQKLVSHMRDCVLDNATLSDFADHCNVSVSYIKLLFKKYANISPKSYYSQLRADEAARLLAGGMSVSDVSERMSFSSPSYFTVFFKRYYGMSPLDFRRKG